MPLFNANKKDFSVLPDGSLGYSFTEHTGARCATAERKNPLEPIRQKIGTADQVRIAAEVSIESTLSPVGATAEANPVSPPSVVENGFVGVQVEGDDFSR